MIGDTLLHYRLLSQTGSDVTGTLYRAADLKRKREVALQMLPPLLAADDDRLARLQHDLRTAAALNHPNIVTLHSVEEDAGRHFVVMELAAGRPLSQTIPPGGLGFDDFFAIALKLADALAAAHEHGLAHATLSLADVLVADDGTVKIKGLGLASLIRDAVEPPTAIRDDIVAWGLICCELLIGRKVQSEASARTLHQLALREDPDFVSRWRPDVPAELSRLISRCVQGTAVDDPHAMRGIAQELQALQTRFYTGELTYLPLSPEAAQSRKTIVNWTLAFVLLNLLFALFAFFYWKR